MHPDQLDLERVEQDLKSTHQPTRYAAVHRMRTWIRLSPACHPDALRIFRQVLSNPQDGGTVNAALSGLEELNYKSDAQNVRLYLLNSPHPDVVRTALLGFRDVQCAPLLINLLSKHTHPDVQIALVRSLCKMPTPPNSPSPSSSPSLPTPLSAPTSPTP